MPELARHQRDAVERAMVMIARHGGAILADDVGLGKSYIAACVAAEWQRLGSDVEIIVPAALTGQWRETLREFRIDARLITHDTLATDPLLGERERFLVIDEAHTFRNRRTQRWSALARRSIASRLLLVTATPICNSADDLLALIALIASDDAMRCSGVASIDDTFAVGDGPSLDIVIRELVIRRERNVLPPELFFGTLDRHVIRHPIVASPIDALQFPLSNNAALLRQFLRRRLESSPAALLESVRRQRRFYERVVESGRPLSRRDYRQAFAAEADGDAFQQILFWDLVAAPEDGFDTKAIRDEMERLASVRAAVEHAEDGKALLLEAALTDEPTLIFTGAAATARALSKRLRCGLATARDGSAAIDAFRRGTIDRLVATDLASEGLNLQRAGVVVHYDIPWNPVKLDQRNGRACRIGQTRDAVRAIYFLPEQRSRVVETIASKNRTRRRILGSHPRPIEIAPPVLDLPQHLPDGSPALALILALRAQGLTPPPALFRRHRAGVEQLFDEMSHEYLDGNRLSELEKVLERERAMTSGWRA